MHSSAYQARPVCGPSEAAWGCAQVREARVRKAGIGGRARLAGELREMDAEARTGS